MITLGVETSCDETSISVVDNGHVLSNVVSSSVHLHAKYGGVIPEIASRYHTEYIYSVFQESLKKASIDATQIKLVAVTKGPGLPGSLLVGIAFAKSLSYSLNVPIIGVDHVRAHAVSPFLNREKFAGLGDEFPFLSMVISGGHTNIYDCVDIKKFELIGQTIDDAVGEAFDKVSKVMELGYPGGPIVEARAAKYAGKDKIKFPRAFLSEESGLDVSLSGIKTAVMYHWRDSSRTEEEKTRICFSFQDAVMDIIEHKVSRAIQVSGRTRIVFGGGVLNNDTLRKRIINRCNIEAVEVLLPEKEFSGDNAAMIAFLGEELFNSGEVSDLYLKAELS